MNRNAITHEKRRSIGVILMLMLGITTGFTFETKRIKNPNVSQIATSTPAAIPSPTRQSGNQSSSLDFQLELLTSGQTIQENGIVKTTAHLLIGTYRFGTLQLTSPSSMKLGQTGVIRLLITPDSVLAGLPQVNIPALSNANNAPSSAAQDPNASSYFIQLDDRLLISSLMVAELKGIKFEIVSSSSSEKSIVASMPAEWVWLIEPFAPGNQVLILSISIPVINEQYFGTHSFQTVKNIPVEISVEVTPTAEPTQTPVPTNTPIPTNIPTPLPLITRMSERLVENVSTIFVAILGLIGVLAGVYVTYMNAKKAEVEKSSTKKPKKK